MQATEILCPEMEAKICGRKAVRMVFSHHQMRMSELYWQYCTRGKLGYFGIVDQAIARTYIGLGAIAYGAVAAAAMDEGKAPIAMRDFDKICTYDELRALATNLIGCVIESMPKGGGDRKNALRRPQGAKTTHGGRSSGEDCAPASDTRTSGE